MRRLARIVAFGSLVSSHSASSVLLDTQSTCDADGNKLSADDADRCDIPEIQTCEEFSKTFWNRAPAVIRGGAAGLEKQLKEFQQLTSREALLNNDLSIKLSTSVSYTGKVFTETTVSEYVKDDTPASVLGNETYYLFGNHEGEDWARFLDTYPRLERSPMFSCLHLDPAEAAMSFGCAKQGSGVPWHFHGSGFLQVLSGSKLWFLTPFEVSNEQIGFDPNITTRAWYEEEYLKKPSLHRLIVQCHLYEGDIIYFPPMWRHATYNTGKWNSWISTFLKD